uniref:Thioredoxin domain-containing protein 17 n=1 Tax=Zosterops lateralis melanops TaxID=1220523 RepID=A0A8D2PL19_ZOSLA
VLWNHHAVLGHHTQDRAERGFLFVLEEKLAFTQTQVQSPVVRKELHNLPDESVFIYCLVGDRAYWKDPNNEFRKNLKLTAVPTLLKYGTPQKLVEEECFKAELVRMLFTED